jgi:DNA replication and repair protein RecF
LFDALAALAAQVWMTGADPAPFADVASRAQIFTIGAGRVAPAA